MATRTRHPSMSHRLAVVSLGCALAVGTPALALATEDPTTEPDAASASDSTAISEATASSTSDIATETTIELSDDGVLVNGSDAATQTGSTVYISHDVVYYEDRDTYDSGNAYGEGSSDDRHTAEEAAAVTVVNITEPGTYRISGTLSNGQISVDLGEDAYDDPDAVVTLILDGVDLTCEIAPALVFYNVYECDGDWSVETATPDVDTSNAGANIVLADGSENTVTGSHVARIYQDTAEQKKLWKIDSAIHSFMSLTINGEEEGTGVLNVVADNEGIESDLHLTVDGGTVNVTSQDDGFNSNEDGVSVTTINGGTVHILAGLGSEGDGIDSNGYLVINGGTVIAMANPASDSGLDSDMGSYINGGTVVALGSTMDWAEGDSDQVTMNLQFASSQDAGDAIVVTDEDGTIVFAYDPSEDETAGTQVRNYLGAIVSCVNFEVGAAYHVYIGGAVEGEEVQGVYDVETITGYEGGVQQAYTGTDVSRGPGAMMGGNPDGMGGQGGPGNRGAMGGERPEGGNPDDWGQNGQGEPGESDGPSDRPEDGGPDDQGEPGETGERPQDTGAEPGDSDERPTPPEGEPDDADANPVPPTDIARSDQTDENIDGPADGLDDGGASTEFYLQDNVNAFSGVAAAN